MGLSKKINKINYNDFFNGITLGKLLVSGLLIASLQTEAHAENFIVSMQHVVANFNDGLEKAASWDFGTKLNPETNRYEYIKKDNKKIRTSFGDTIGANDLLQKDKKYFKNVVGLRVNLENKENLKHELDLELIKYIYRNLYSVSKSSPVYKDIEKEIIETYNESLKYLNNSGLTIINNSNNFKFEKIKDVYKKMSEIAFFEQLAFDINNKIKKSDFNNFSNYEKREIPKFLKNIYEIYMDASNFKIDQNKIKKLYKELSEENSNTKIYKYMIKEITELFSNLETIEDKIQILNSNKRTIEGVFKESYSQFANEKEKRENIYDEIDSL